MTRGRHSQHNGGAVSIAIIAVFLCFASCKRSPNIVLLTNIKEAPLYAEMFNSEKRGEVVVSLRYSENPAEEIRKNKGHGDWDIVVAPYLQSGMHYFCDISSVCKTEEDSQKYYPQLLRIGVGKGGMFDAFEAQRLLPVSFNVTAVIFDKANENAVAGDGRNITLDDIKRCSKAFDKKGKNGYTRIGFLPETNEIFLQLVKSMYGDKKGKEYIQDWTDASEAERANFEYKYLTMPPQKQVTSGKCLFAVVTSDMLFGGRLLESIDGSNLTDIGNRYIVDDKGSSLVRDDIMMIGIKRGKRNKKTEAFVKWFLDADTQRQILERKEDENLETDMFGIAGGFSAIVQVNSDIARAPLSITVE